MPLKLYNTASKVVEELRPLDGDRVTLYTCGPTVYDYLTVGNWSAYIYWDTLVRALLVAGYRVERVMNITDVGHLVSDADDGQDKLEKGAQREGKTAWEIAEFYAEDFVAGMEKLGLIPPEHLVKATDFIPQQLELVRTLKQKGYTYQTTDGIYFDTSKFPRYANFAHLDLEAQKAGARVEANDEKRQPWDFALWKFTPAGEKRDMEWETPGDLLEASHEYGIGNLEYGNISYIMGQQDITQPDIEAIGGKIVSVTSGGHLCVVFPLESAADYEKLIAKKMRPGFWNEYVNEHEVVFIFKHGEGALERHVLDSSTDKTIRQLGDKFLSQPYDPEKSTWDWLYDNSWYKDSPQLAKLTRAQDSTPKTTQKMGFPGWHLECSAMAMSILGPTIDIHTGGIDHIPVHHTNEIAQSEAASGQQFANIWLHNNHLKIDGGKISKSLGNGYTLSDIEAKGFSPMDLRMFVLQGLFTNEGNFTFENLQAAKNRRENWLNYAALRHQTHDSLKDDDRKNDDANHPSLQATVGAIREALLNNLNTPEALRIVDNAFANLDNQSLGNIHRHGLVQLLEAIDELLGLQLQDSTPDIDDATKKLLIERQRAREAKDWQQSDTLREQLRALGINVKDVSDGPIWSYEALPKMSAPTPRRQSAS